MNISRILDSLPERIPVRRIAWYKRPIPQAPFGPAAQLAAIKTLGPIAAEVLGHYLGAYSREEQKKDTVKQHAARQTLEYIRGIIIAGNKPSLNPESKWSQDLKDWLL